MDRMDRIQTKQMQVSDLQQNKCRARIVSEDYQDYILTNEWDYLFENVADSEICNQRMDFVYKSVYVSRGNGRIPEREMLPYYAVPQCYALMDLETLTEAGIAQVQNYPTLQLQGSGVLIGFIDTGIDYEHPVFRNVDGSTRIVGIWDQSDQTGRTPRGLDYGSVYTREDIDAALELQNPREVVPHTDTNGHGTFVASVAAGSADVENRFLGAAPDASIAMVKLKGAKTYLREYYGVKSGVECYQENDIMLGCRYLHALANEYDLPLVICIALGCSLGGHNGTTPLSELLEIYGNLVNRVIVTGTGNEADKRHHFQGILTEETPFQNVEIRVGQGVSAFVMELWTDIPNIMTVGLTSPSGETIEPISIRQSSGIVYRFLLEQTTVKIEYRISGERTNSELIFFRFEDPVEGIWTVQVQKVQLTDGVYHMWMPVSELLDGEIYFLESNPECTVTEPGSTPSAITTAFYNGSENSIAISSGRGYTRNNKIKPEMAAPGIDVTGAIPRGRFAQRSGSSVGTAVMAGASALMSEWIVYQLGGRANSAQIKEVLILGTMRRSAVPYPNREWGYGTLNVYNTFEVIRNF